MNCGELMAKYGASEHAIRNLGIERLNVMTEDARALLVGMSMRPGPSKEAIKAATRRIVLELRMERRMKREIERKLALHRKAYTPVPQQIGGETVHIAPMAVMGAELLGLPEKKLPRSNEDGPRVKRMIELSRRVG